jgi:AraC-like DNA-binding protein
VDTLAAELGCSRRYLVAGFREQVGVPPKTLARILRFHRAVGMMGSGPGWAEIALSCGYYDQAHLIRDFNQFAGSSPSDFARRRLPDGGGVVGD